MPKNILMIGSTGVGKTEIARRLAKLDQSPFLKVEASKFTEVGYVGRDVESIVRDLVEVAIDMVREEKLEEIEDRAELAAEDRLLEMLLMQQSASPAPAVPAEPEPHAAFIAGQEGVEDTHQPSPVPTDNDRSRERERLRQQFREGRLDDRLVELETRDRGQPQIEILSESATRRDG